MGTAIWPTSACRDRRPGTGGPLRRLRGIWLSVLAPNTAALRAYEKAGFQHVGRRRAAGYWDGRHCDEVLMDALPTDIQ